MFRKVGYFSTIICFIGSIIVAISIWQNNLPLVSPISFIETLIGNSPALKSKKIIYGFFPYWNVKYSNQLNIQHLTHFAYFAVDLNPDGTINKKVNTKETEPGWNKLNSATVEKLLYQSKILGQQTVLTVTAMEPELIESIINNPTNRQTAINSIITVYNDYGFEDVNIDFEYLGNSDEISRSNFVTFIKDLRSSCIQAKSNCKIDIDIFGNTAESYRLWDLEKLSPIVDRFIVMTYDYYRKSSSQAGPVAPIIGKCTQDTPQGQTCLEWDVNTHISQITKVIPSEKIILGIPFYGYEWQTASDDYLANTYKGTGALATYQRIQLLFSDTEISSLSAKWSPISLSPYITYMQKDKIYQIHFENSQSLIQKIKLVNSANLGGVAIWAIGYETPYAELWEPISSLFNP